MIKIVEIKKDKWGYEYLRISKDGGQSFTSHQVDSIVLDLISQAIEERKTQLMHNNGIDVSVHFNVGTENGQS